MLDSRCSIFQEKPANALLLLTYCVNSLSFYGRSNQAVTLATVVCWSFITLVKISWKNSMTLWKFSPCIYTVFKNHIKWIIYFKHPIETFLDIFKHNDCSCLSLCNSWTFVTSARKDSRKNTFKCFYKHQFWGPFRRDIIFITSMLILFSITSKWCVCLSSSSTFLKRYFWTSFSHLWPPFSR